MSAQVALVNGRIVLPGGVVDGEALLIEDEVIRAITLAGDLPSDAERIDVAGAYIAPGLVDIHTHGALGRSFLDGDEEAFAVITEAQARRGVTSLLPTTSTAPLEQIKGCLARTRKWMARSRDGAGAGGRADRGAGRAGDSAGSSSGREVGRARSDGPGSDRGSRVGSNVIGAHVEGPYFAAAQAGAQDPANLRTPDDGSVEQLLEYADAIRIMSFAPELPGALELARRLRSLGIVAALGHSSATDREVQAATHAGASHAIHLWSGQSMTVRQGPWRRPGILEASLASDTFSGEIIADGKHLPATLMKLAYRCLGSDRLCLVSDATSGAGLGDGEHFRMGEMEYMVRGGVGMMLDESGFAGSTTFLSEMVPLVADTLGISLHEAVRMASLTPATVAGVSDRKGSIEAGKDADIALFDSGFSPLCTMIAGRWTGTPSQAPA